MQSSSQGPYRGYQGYQGYPYSNPVVNDIPTIDAATASRWANLPRRALQMPGPSRVIPGTSGTGSSSQNQQAQSSNERVPPKRDIDENPVVYIDLPEAGSEVSQSIDTPGTYEPEFVQDTIMYDPFENRRIDRPKEDAGSISSGTESTQSYEYPGRTTSPMRPNTLNLASPSGSGMQSPASSNRQPPTLPSFMTKESLVYGGDGADGFPVSPIPISEFPRPPPAYTEVASPQSPANEPVPETQAAQPPPPSTQVIYNSNGVNVVTAQYKHGKNLICHCCGIRVHTLVVKEVGYMTHFIAFCVFVLCMPLVLVVYLTDCFKHTNHYCPNCNRLIGFVKPLLGSQITLVV